MKSGFTLKSLVVATACLCAVTGSAALTLGRAQGLALIGQPLDLRIQVQFDSAEDAQSACLNAEVIYGDTPLDASRVRVAVDVPADVAGSPASVRVSATVPVNEPVVTVNLRSGCQVRSSKRYTLLADLATQVVEPTVRPPVRAPLPVAPLVERPMVAVPVRADTEAAPKPRKPKPVSSATVTPPPVPPLAASPARAPKAGKTSSKSRLKLDPLDLLIERDPILRASDELLSQPQESGPQRAEAAALWRALNASPEQILREEVQSQRAMNDLKALYTVTNENQKGLIELAARVERAQSERYANGLVYTLMALCAISLVALVWFWTRMRNARQADWMDGLDAGDSLIEELVQADAVSRHSGDSVLRPQETPVAARTVAAPPEPVRTPAPVAQPASRPRVVAPVEAPVVAPVVAPVAPVATTGVDFDLDLNAPLENIPVSGAAHFDDPWATRPGDASAVWQATPPPELPATVRSIDTDEMADIRHQAQFFVSLGQHDKAVDILTARIAQSGDSSPLICLDLLQIYHDLGRESEYAFMRAGFQHWFAGQVPEFSEFGYEGRSLDRYPEVMSHITKLWPGPGVLEAIENCLCHDPGAVDGQDFDLQAFRDLLLLHTVATDLIRMADGPGSRTLKGGQESDPQANVETRGVPLEPTKVSQAVAMPGSMSAVSPDPAEDDPLTDINFLNLR